MRRKLLALIVAMALAIIGAILGTSLASGSPNSATPHEAQTNTSQTTTPTESVPPANPIALRETAVVISKQYGDPSPEDIVYVTGTHNHEAIEKLTGTTEELAGNVVVDVVQEHGNFSVPTEPHGYTPPTGHSLTLVIDRETNEATDIYMAEGNEPGPNLASLGRGEPAPLP